KGKRDDLWFCRHCGYLLFEFKFVWDWESGSLGFQKGTSFSASRDMQVRGSASGRNSRGWKTRHLNGALRSDVDFDLLWLEVSFTVTSREERELLVGAGSESERAGPSGGVPPKHR